MDFKLLGSVLIIVGTSIGAGMLALPVATANAGYLGAVILLFACWLFMTLGAYLLLEVNLWLGTNSNLNSMAKQTIGPLGQLISWISIILLLYSLLCAYIGGGSDLFHSILLSANIDMSMAQASFLFTFIFGFIVYIGIRAVDYVNRGLMLIKFLAYFFLVILLMPFLSWKNINSGHIENISSFTAIMVTITSFGYASIVPSLRIYLAGDIIKLKKAILIGSAIPLVCYLAWDLAIMGTLPLHGPYGLTSILHSDESTSALVNGLKNIVNNHAIDLLTRLFTSICVLTSFLCVSLGVTDFWADVLQVEKKGFNNLLIMLLTFLPPLIVVLFIPGIFLKALKYAGINCVLLLALMPALMALMGRKKFKGKFKVFGGKTLLYILIAISLLLIGKGLIETL